MNTWAAIGIGTACGIVAAFIILAIAYMQARLKTAEWEKTAAVQVKENEFRMREALDGAYKKGANDMAAHFRQKEIQIQEMLKLSQYQGKAEGSSALPSQEVSDQDRSTLKSICPMTPSQTQTGDPSQGHPREQAEEL